MKGEVFNDGYTWDFSRKHCMDRSLHIIDEQRPLFIILSSERTPYSIIQNLNTHTPAGKAEVEVARRRGDA